jgi:AcrR family transcriptional regulator
MAVERATPRATPVDRAGRQGGHVLEMQRRRLLSATVELAYEGGVQALTVAMVCERAGLSRKTFYDIFDGREDCLYATFIDAVEQATRTVVSAVDGEERWRGKIRVALTALLGFLDYEPGMGRLLVVEALSSGEHTLSARGRVLAQIITIVDEGREEIKAGREPPPLTAEGLVGAVFSVIHARMIGGDTQPLLTLTGALMAMIVAPYLGPAASQRELDRPTMPVEHTAPRLPSDPFKDLPLRLTYRTARVLSSIARTPGASSKQIALASGITDDGQTSRLLSRLQRHGLIQDTGIGPTMGQARAWTLTGRGEDILQATGQA